MKNLFFTLLLIVSTIGVLFSQVPATFNYQAVVRNSSGEIITNQNVKFKISILKSSESGTVVYSETHSVTTNSFGLVNLKIGGGTVVTGTFDLNEWKNGKHFIKTEIDPNGGSSFSLLGTSELSSVPYAIHAQTVENDKVDDADADPTNEIQQLSISGTLLELSNGGGSVTLPSTGGSSGDNWGTQKVVSDATLTGEGTTANPLSVVADGDGDDTNELQTLSLNGNDLSLSDGGTVTLPSGGSGLWEEFGSVIYRNSGSVAIGTNNSYGQLTIETTSETGINNEGTFEGSGLQTGLNNNLRGSSDANRIGVYNDFKCTGSGNHTGVFNFFAENCNANKTGTDNRLGGSGNGYVTGTSNDISSSGNGTHYGVYSTLSGTGSGEKYGTYNVIESSAGGTHYAVYGEAEKTGSYAGYFKGAVAIKDGTQGAGKVLTSDTNGNATWQTPAAGGGSSLWAESGSDIYRSSGAVGIGTTPETGYDLDIRKNSKDAVMRLASGNESSFIYLDKHSAADQAEIYFQTNGTFKFRSGLNSNGNYEINASNTEGNLTGIKVTQFGDVEISHSLNVGDHLTTEVVTVNNELDIFGELMIDNNSELNVFGRMLVENNFCISTNPGAGKVLTSDANGNATWQTPAAGGSSLWTESGSDIYRSSGAVGIGTTSPNNNYLLDAYNENGNAIINLKSNTNSAFLYLDKKTAGYYAEIGFQVDGVTKFYTGLTNNGSYEINASTGNDIVGLEVESDGDVKVTKDLTVEKEVHLATSGNANMVPIMYGSINSDATIAASSGNFSVSKSGRYYIESDYFNFTNDSYVVVASLRGYAASIYATCNGGKIEVVIVDFNEDMTSMDFSFVVYKI